MISLDDAIYEVGDSTSSMRFEARQDRLAGLAAASRSGDRVSRARRVAVLVGDYVAGFRCLVQSPFASESGVTAC